MRERCEHRPGYAPSPSTIEPTVHHGIPVGFTPLRYAVRLGQAAGIPKNKPALGMPSGWVRRTERCGAGGLSRPVSPPRRRPRSEPVRCCASPRGDQLGCGSTRRQSSASRMLTGDPWTPASPRHAQNQRAPSSTGRHQSAQTRRDRLRRGPTRLGPTRLGQRLGQRHPDPSETRRRQRKPAHRHTRALPAPTRAGGDVRS